MQGTQYATKRSILCRGAFCGPTVLAEVAISFVDVISYVVIKMLFCFSLCAYLYINAASVMWKMLDY